MQVFKTVEEDGSAEMTVSFGDDDHRFSVWSEGSTAYVQYEETQLYRGEVVVAEPDDDIYRALMQSDEMTDYLDSQELRNIQRADNRHKV